MRKRVTYRSTLAAIACALSLSAHAIADTPRQIDVPAGDLVTALESLAKQAQIDLVYQPEQLRAFRTNGLRGSYDPKDAVRLLLQGTPLELRTDPTGAMVIAPARGRAREQTSEHSGSPGERLRFAQADASVKTENTASPGEVRLDEIVVTAQKRTERMQDVPVPVSVIAADELLSTNQTRLQDYYSTVPGLSVAPVGTQSTQILSIRGINTGIAGNPSVGITIDDVPYGASTNLGGGPLVPDIDPFDLARVEVLRGPQGTLYGASSLGGLIKFVTVDPSTGSTSGRLQADVNGIQHGDQAGYGVRGAINLPVTDTLAFRLSGFGRSDPGYIDNSTLGLDGVNRVKAYGGRLCAMWRPLETVTVRFSALYQQVKSDGSSDVDLSLGDLQQNYLRGIGGYLRRFQAYSATVTAKLGGIEFTSITGYNINAYNDSWDPTYIYGQFAESLYGVGGAPAFDVNKTRKVSQEIRAAASVGEHFDWTVGAFYTHESSYYRDDFTAVDASTGQSAGLLLSNAFPTTYTDYAAFVNLTYRFGDHWDVQIGARESHLRQSFAQTQAGPFAAPDISGLDTSANAATYLLTPRFKLSPDSMAYFRLASGYRAGGTNALIGGADTGLPLRYSPDKTVSYELGLKSSLFENRLTLDGSLYYIDWKSIQLSLFDPNSAQAYVSNAGRAKSQGIELSAAARPTSATKLSTWVTYNDAVLKEGFPEASTAAGGAYGAKGDRLPYGARFSGGVSIEQQMALPGSVVPFIGAALSYVGNRVGEFTTSPARQVYPAYTKADLRAGLAYHSVTATLFVNNLTDRRALLGGGLGSFPPFAFTVIQPRTVGLTVSMTF